MNKANALEKEVEKQIKLRSDERMGRITVQRQTRKEANDENNTRGYNYIPIGKANMKYSHNDLFD